MEVTLGDRADGLAVGGDPRQVAAVVGDLHGRVAVVGRRRRLEPVLGRGQPRGLRRRAGQAVELAAGRARRRRSPTGATAPAPSGRSRSLPRRSSPSSSSSRSISASPRRSRSAWGSRTTWASRSRWASGSGRGRRRLDRERDRCPDLVLGAGGRVLADDDPVVAGAGRFRADVEACVLDRRGGLGQRASVDLGDESRLGRRGEHDVHALALDDLVAGRGLLGDDRVQRRVLRRLGVLHAPELEVVLVEHDAHLLDGVAFELGDLGVAAQQQDRGGEGGDQGEHRRHPPGQPRLLPERHAVRRRIGLDAGRAVRDVDVMVGRAPEDQRGRDTDPHDRRHGLAEGDHRALVADRHRAARLGVLGGDHDLHRAVAVVLDDDVEAGVPAAAAALRAGVHHRALERLDEQRGLRAGDIGAERARARDDRHRPGARLGLVRLRRVQPYLHLLLVVAGGAPRVQEDGGRRDRPPRVGQHLRRARRRCPRSGPGCAASPSR